MDKRETELWTNREFGAWSATARVNGPARWGQELRRPVLRLFGVDELAFVAGRVE
jgi:hypothetical protein